MPSTAATASSSRLVRQHRPGDHVADRVDAGHAGLEALVHDDAPALVEGDAQLARAQALGVRAAPDGHQHDVGLDDRWLARTGERDAHAVAGALGRLRLRREAEGEALLARARAGAASTIARRPTARCGRGTRPPGPRQPSRRHTEPSSSPTAPAPTTSRRSGTCGSASASVGADDALAVERQRRAARSARCRWRAGRAPPRASVSPSAPAHGDAVGARRAGPCPASRVTLCFLNSPAMPCVRPCTILSLRAIIAGRSSVTSPTCTPCTAEAVARQMEVLARIEQRLRRDAADVEARAAERRVLLDARHAHAELRGADGAGVARRARSR